MFPITQLVLGTARSMCLKQQVFTFTNVLKAFTKEVINDIKQKLFNTGTQLGNNEIMLTHFINGKKIKIVIKCKKSELHSVYNENDDSYFEQVEPFYSYEVVPFQPRFINVEEPIILIPFKGEPITVTNEKPLVPKPLQEKIKLLEKDKNT